MIGQYQHSIDAKGRLFIPARLREKLGNTFYVTIGMDKYKFLSVFSEASWKNFTDRIASLPLSKAGQVRLICGNAVCCEPDSQGRVVLNNTLIEHAQIAKDAIVVGCGDYAEIWSAEEYDRIIGGEDADELRDALEALGL